MFKLFQKKVNGSLLQFVGYFVAHMAWQTEEGDNVVPLVAFEANGQRKFERFSSESYEEAKGKAELRYQELTKSKSNCVLIYDGFITIGDARSQSLIIEGKSDKHSIKLALPYKSKKDMGGPKIYKPKIISSEGIDINKEFAEFFNGVYSHEKAWEYWEANIDESQ